MNILDIPNFGNKLIQLKRMGESNRHKWVNVRQSYMAKAMWLISSQACVTIFPVHEHFSEAWFDHGNQESTVK